MLPFLFFLLCIVSTLSLSIEKSSLSEGDMLRAVCRARPTYPPPDAVFLQFEDKPAEILVTGSTRVAVNQLPQFGVLVTATLNYTVSRYDDGRSIRVRK